MNVEVLGARELRVVPPESGVYRVEALSAPAVTPRASEPDADGIVVLDRDLSPGAAYRLVAPSGDEALFAGHRTQAPPGRAFRLWDMLPRASRRADATGDLAALVACLQDVVDLLLTRTDAFADWIDFARAPEPMLDAMLRDLGSTFAFPTSAAEKRRLLAVLVRLYRQKGTKPGLRNAIRVLLGIEIDTVSAIQEQTLVLGESELGVDWILAPSDRRSLYSFEVLVDRVITPRERRAITDVVLYAKPAHTHLLGIVEPLLPPGDDAWVLGVGRLGEARVS